MTIFYPDLSNWNAGYIVPAGTQVVVAKATEGNYYHDASYHDFKYQAGQLGATFSGYHFLKEEISPEEQAQYYFDFAGVTPCMVDCETSGNSTPGVDWCLRFKKALEALGGRVWSVYYPQWYLGLTGGSLDVLGVPIVASQYRSYEENNWPGSYGGITPIIWQYTSTPVDMNAFKGTADQLSALITGDDVTPDDIKAIAKAVYEYSEESVNINGKPYQASLGQLAHGSHVSTNDPNGLVLKALANLQASVAALYTKVDGLSVASGASPQAVAAETLAELKAKL